MSYIRRRRRRRSRLIDRRRPQVKASSTVPALEAHTNIKQSAQRNETETKQFQNCFEIVSFQFHFTREGRERLCLSRFFLNNSCMHLARKCTIGNI